MCNNARNRCSWIVAMEKDGQINAAISAYVRMVNGKKRGKTVEVPQVRPYVE